MRQLTQWEELKNRCLTWGPRALGLSGDPGARNDQGLLKSTCFYPLSTTTRGELCGPLSRAVPTRRPALPQKRARRAPSDGREHCGAFPPSPGLVARRCLPTDAENFPRPCWKSSLCTHKNCSVVYLWGASKCKWSFLAPLWLSVWLGNGVSHWESIYQRGTGLFVSVCLSVPS